MPFHEYRSRLLLSSVPELFHVVFGKPRTPGDGADPSARGRGDARNEEAARGAFPAAWKDMPIARVSQVHGTELAILSCGENADGVGKVLAAMDGMEADGLVSEGPGALLRIVVADCMPVFLVDAVRKRTSLVHAGWRGLAAGIIRNSIESLAERGTAPADLVVWIGPHISPGAYEVGPEVIAAFPDRPPVYRPGRGDRVFLDLYETARVALQSSGVPAESIEERPPCTLTDDRLFSHRAGDSGRNVAFLGFGK